MKNTMETNYKSYLKQILKYPLLTPSEELKLSYKVQSGDLEAKKELINRNLRLVVSIARKYCDSYTNLMDLIQEGNIGLITAAGKYNYSYNTRFSTYAYAWIAQSMLRYLQTKSQMISIPVRKEEIIHKIETAKNELINKNNREPSDSEISSYSGIVMDTIKSSRNYKFSIASIDYEVEPGSGQTFGDTLADTKRNPEDEALYNCRREMVEDLVETLPESEKIIIQNRYSLASHDRKTLRQIGSLLGLSAETVRQKEKRAIKRMYLVANSNTERYSI